MKLHTHSSVETGKEFDVAAMKDEFLPAKTWEKGMYGSDMDWTMVLNDTGALLFVRYLMRPDFYRLEPQVLHEMLLPDVHVGELSTREFIVKGSEGAYVGVNPADCDKALRAREEITNMYTDLRGIMLNGGPTTPAQQSALLEFVTKIVELDSLLIALKNQYSSAVTANKMAAAFSRYRLFGGQDSGMIGETIHTLLEMDPAHPDRYLKMRAGDATHDKLDQKVVVNAPVFDFLSAVRKEGAEGRIVTASPAEVAQAVIRGSVYRTLFTPDEVIATKLEKDAASRLSGRLDGPMMAGVTKTESLQNAADATGKTVKLALGDLPGSDAAMGALALQNNGVFVIAHQPGEVDRVRGGFDSYLKRILGPDLSPYAERIWYIPTREHDEKR